VEDQSTSGTSFDMLIHAAADLTDADRKACIKLIAEGDAVDPDSAADELPLASAVVTIRKNNEIVGVGVIKRIRAGYAADIAKKSRWSFDPAIPELGYVAISEAHQGARLSGQIVTKLLTHATSTLFATTSNERMKKTLARAGFVQQGREWKGKKTMLSLWLRDIL
jgi:RimJ/RimL family protein N-acetyltransferase